MNLIATPHTKLQIRFIGTVAVQYFPRFQAAILGEYKKVRHFYKRPNLRDFYAATKDFSAVKTASEEQLVYMKGGMTAEVTWDLPGFSDLVPELKTLYEVDPGSVYLAGDKAKWGNPLTADQDIMYPWTSKQRDAIEYIVLGEPADPVTVEADGEETLPEATSKLGSLVIQIGDANFFTVPATATLPITNVNTADFCRKGAVVADITLELKVDEGDAANLKLVRGDDATGDTVTARWLQAYYTKPAFPETATEAWFYTGDAHLDVAADIQAGKPWSTHDDSHAVQVRPQPGAGPITYEMVAKSSDFWGSLFGHGAIALYSNWEDTAWRHPVASDAQTVNNTQVGGMQDLKNNAGHTLLIADVHAEYTASFSTLDNNFINQVYTSVPAESRWMLEDEGYTWGLPHPDNPLGFATNIMFTTIGSPTARFMVVVSENKAKGFDLIANEIPKAMFIANVWEEYGEGGLSEPAWLANLESESGMYPVLFTWQSMSPYVFRIGSEEEFSATPGTITTGTNILTDGAGVNFQTEGVVTGDIVEMVYSDNKVQKAFVVVAGTDTLTLNRTAIAEGPVDYKVYKKFTSEEAKNHYISKMGSDRFNMFVGFNQAIQWGSHLISNKWIMPAVAAMRTVYPEQQPLTGVLMDMGKFGVAYGGYDFFGKYDLDALIDNGYYILITDPEAATSYAVRDVSAGIKSQDFRRGEGQAVIPICTFGASCRKVLERLKGKYTKTPALVEKVKLTLAAVEARYQKPAAIPELGPMLVVARFKNMDSIRGGYRMTLETLPHEQANIFEIVIEVIKPEEVEI